MDFAKAAQIVAIMLSPTVAIGVALHTPRMFRALQKSVRGGTGAEVLGPRNPPIEQLAADLRRLLLRHETLKRSTREAMRFRRMVAMEAAISDCATEAARALGVPYPQQTGRGSLPTPHLRQLLRGLVDAGLVLPPDVSLLTAGGPDRGVTQG